MPLIEPRPIPDPDDLGRVHFIAIGGAGMSGVAAGCLARGLTVSGCDQADSEALAELAGQGAQVMVGHDPSHLEGVDTVVVSSAIPDGNAELAEARRRGLPVLHRSLALASLMAGRRVVSVAGTHGKTTTTAMCVAGLRAAGSDPSYVIGATMVDSGLAAHIGADREFVVEADESDGTFRQYPTAIAVITGIDPDHLDNYGTPENYEACFAQFAAGDTVELVILDGDDPGAARLRAALLQAGRPVLAYGRSPDCDLVLSEVELDGATSRARLTCRDWSATLRLVVPGVHNLRDAAAACCVAWRLGADLDRFLAGLAAFHGTARRFQTVAVVDGVRVIDDYAHHPTEIAATVAAAREVVGDGRIIACFQPHLFSRTRDFADDFGRELARADQVVVVDVYPAREQPIPGVTGELVAEAVRAHGGRVTYVPSLDDALDELAGTARCGDLVLTIGAGSVTGLGPRLAARLGQP